MATLTVPPMLRKNCRPAVTSPIRVSGKAFCTTIVNRLIIMPMPSPTTTMLRTTSAEVVAAVMRESRNMPMAATANPVSAGAL